MCSRERDALVYGDAVCCYSFLPPPYTHTLHTTTIVLSLPALHTCRRKSSSFAVARALIGLPLPDCGIGTRVALPAGLTGREQGQPGRSDRPCLPPSPAGRWIVVAIAPGDLPLHRRQSTLGTELSPPVVRGGGSDTSDTTTQKRHTPSDVSPPHLCVFLPFFFRSLSPRSFTRQGRKSPAKNLKPSPALALTGTHTHTHTLSHIHTLAH